MDYYDGNTVTALWNYAQNYAMSDNNWDTTFGPSTPGALNLISGSTGGGYAVDPTTGRRSTDPGSGQRPEQQRPGHASTATSDPAYDDCSDSQPHLDQPARRHDRQEHRRPAQRQERHLGLVPGRLRADRDQRGRLRGLRLRSTTNIGGNAVTDYSPHHNPFEYYKSTANPKHLPPSSEAAIGHTDQANHEYDLSDFYETLKDGNMPSVSFLKAAEYQDAHPGYSDPLDEQTFLVNTINQIEESKYWASTAIVITYDDSDGWYDHQAPLIVNGSNTSAGRRDLHTRRR